MLDDRLLRLTGESGRRQEKCLPELFRSKEDSLLGFSVVADTGIVQSQPLTLLQVAILGLLFVPEHAVTKIGRKDNVWNENRRGM